MIRTPATNSTFAIGGVSCFVNCFVVTESSVLRMSIPNDVKRTYLNASILKYSRIVFNIQGNSYRLVVNKDLCYWIDKNAVAYSLIGNFDLFEETEIMKWTQFSILYAALKKIKSYTSNHIEEFRLANYQSKKIQTEQDLVDWIVKYEDIYEEASSDLKYCFVKGKGNFRLFPKNPILLCDPIFDDTFSFFKFFQGHFDDVFLKYSTYIDQENSILFNNGGSRSYGVANFSLKFHLAHRKAIEELGTDVPFYLNKRS